MVRSKGRGVVRSKGGGEWSEVGEGGKCLEVKEGVVLRSKGRGVVRSKGGGGGGS